MWNGIAFEAPCYIPFCKRVDEAFLRTFHITPFLACDVVFMTAVVSTPVQLGKVLSSTSNRSIFFLFHTGKLGHPACESSVDFVLSGIPSTHDYEVHDVPSCALSIMNNFLFALLLLQ